jgi:hypothetical protein
MIYIFKFGFFNKSILYGWHKKELYRLPQVIGKRFYPLKKLNQIDVNNRKGYLVGSQRKSLAQLENITIFIDKKIQTIKDDDCPF